MTDTLQQTIRAMTEVLVQGLVSALGKASLHEVTALLAAPTKRQAASTPKPVTPKTPPKAKTPKTAKAAKAKAKATKAQPRHTVDGLRTEVVAILKRCPPGVFRTRNEIVSELKDPKVSIELFGRVMRELIHKGIVRKQGATKNSSYSLGI